MVGFIVHLDISACSGAVYGLASSRFANTTAAAAAVGGVANGIVWWVLGALLLMPLFLGMDEIVFAVGEMQWWSLLGQSGYGIRVSGLPPPFLNRTVTGRRTAAGAPA